MKKLTCKTFVFLLLLSLAVSGFAYGCIWIFLPYADRTRAEHELEQKTDQLVLQLRMSKKADSEVLFWNFGRETSADLLLFDASGQRVSLFTFEKFDTDKAQGTENMHDSADALQGAENMYDSADVLQGAENMYDSANALQGDGFKFGSAEALQSAGHPFRFIDSDDEYILVVRYNPSYSEEIAGAVLSSIPYVAAVTIILSFLSAWIFSYYTTHPIIRINQIAGKMAELDFSWYCPDMREDEIGMLSRSINKLSDRLHEALNELSLRNEALEDEIRLEKERERRRMLFFSGISHELKTPLAIVAGQLEGIQAGIGVYKNRDKYLARSLEILGSLNQFIKEVLFVSHIDLAGQTGEKEGGQANQLNLSDLMEQLLDEYAGYAEFYSVNIKQEIEEGLFVYGDELLYQKAIGNIISNAVTHMEGDKAESIDENKTVRVGEKEAGSIIEGYALGKEESTEYQNGYVEVKLYRIHHRIELTVFNMPAYIADEHLPHLFEAFYRVNESDRSKEHGSGLGLYITRMIFETFQVSHSIENTHGGVKFTVVFRGIS